MRSVCIEGVMLYTLNKNTVQWCRLVNFMTFIINRDIMICKIKHEIL